MNSKRFKRLLMIGAIALGTVQATSSVQAIPPPRGAHIFVRSYFNVTNSDDGVADRTVEVYGNVRFNGSTMWNVSSKNAIRATEHDKTHIYTRGRFYDVIFNDPKTWNMIVTGFLNDHDKLSKDDAMWNPLGLPLVVNIKDLFPRNKTVVPRVFTLAGDHDSESADLVLEVGWNTDIY